MNARQQRIATRYAQGDPIVSIALDEDVDVKTVRNVARRAGLPRRRPDQTERNARIVERYAAGERVQQIADDEAVAPAYVTRIGRRAGLPPRTDFRRRYPIDEFALDEPDAVGWWLIGLLAADGSINERERRISLSQRAADVDVLHAFYEYVGCSERPLTAIRHDKGWSRGTYYEARVFSAHMCTALALHGIVPRKTTSLKLGSEAASEPAVWLGLLDGDGSVGHRNGTQHPCISFYGTPSVMQQCSQFWAQHCTLQTGRPPSVGSHRGGLATVHLYCENAAHAARIMLESSPISLVRKRQMLEQIADYRRAPHWRTRQALSKAA